MTISTMNPEQVQLLNSYNIVAQIHDSVTGALTISTLDLKSMRKNHHGLKNITSQLMCKTQKSITFLATITLDPKSWRRNVYPCITNHQFPMPESLQIVN